MQDCFVFSMILHSARENAKSPGAGISFADFISGKTRHSANGFQRNIVLYGGRGSETGGFAKRNGIAGDPVTCMHTEIAGNAAACQQEIVQIETEQGTEGDPVSGCGDIRTVLQDGFAFFWIRGVNIDAESWDADGIGRETL